MRRVLNPELDRKILDTLAEKYHLMNERKGIHLSTLIGCLTRSYLDLMAPVELTDREKLIFATGYALQDVLTPKDASSEQLYEKDGIVYRPDMEFTLDNELVEVKSTRAGVKKYQEGNLPKSWITYMKGGCYMRATDHYNLSVIYVAERPSAAIISETIYFEQDELLDTWLWLLTRRDQYKLYLEMDKPPTPHKYCAEWECKNCRYSFQCDAILMLDEKKQAEKDIKELWPEGGTS